MCGPCTRTAWHAGLLIGIVLSGPALGVEPMPAQHKAPDKPATPTTTPAPSLSLADLEQMALMTNPTLRVAGQ